MPLPGILAEIERAAGRAAAVAIMDAFGGTYRNIPNARLLEQNPASYSDNPFVRVLGTDAALKISRAVAPGGINVEIPLGVAVRSARTRRWVLHYSGKFTVSEIARRLGITARQVTRIRSQLRKEGLIP